MRIEVEYNKEESLLENSQKNFEHRGEKKLKISKLKNLYMGGDCE